MTKPVIDKLQQDKRILRQTDSKFYYGLMKPYVKPTGEQALKVGLKEKRSVHVLKRKKLSR